MIDLSKSCRTLLKSCVTRVTRVTEAVNTVNSEGCNSSAGYTNKKPTCNPCNPVTPVTPTIMVGVTETESVTCCKDNKKCCGYTGYIGYTTKQRTPTTFRDIEIEPLLNPCPLCGSRDFIHGENGGYFCTTCQLGHKGQQVRAGASRLKTNTVFPVSEAKPAKGQQPRQQSLSDQPPGEQDPGRYDYAGRPF